MTEEDPNTQYTKYLTYGAVAVGSYLAYRYLFPDSKIEFDYRYKPLRQSQLPSYPKDKKYWCTNPWDKRPIMRSKSGPASWKPVTFFEVFEQFLKKGPNELFLEQEIDDEKSDNGVSYLTWTRQEIYDNVMSAARSFIHLGLKPWESVCIIGFNSPEWFFADLAAIYAGGLACGLYTTNNHGQCKYIVNHCKARVVVLEDVKQLNKFIKVADELNNVSAIVMWKGSIPDNAKKLNNINVYTWNEFIKLGDDKKDEYNKVMRERQKKITPEQCCTLIYTSGTTGQPKGVMISHDSITWTPRALLNSIPDNQHIDKYNCVVSYLPLSHIAAQICDIHGPISIMAQGGKGHVTIARPSALKGTITVTLQHARPTIFFGVPRVWEKIQEKMLRIGKKSNFIVKGLGSWAKGIGREIMSNRQLNGNQKIPFGYGLANKLVYKTIKEKLGLDRVRYCVSSAAPIKKSTIEYFGSIGINIVEAYGMSELTGAHTVGRNYHNIVGSIGATIGGSETVILHDRNRDKPKNGEICMRGRNVMMGYIYNEDKTKSTIDDEGLLHSGDVGTKDDNDLVYITGRIKELIITAGGENVAPVPIEDYIKDECSGIANFMVIGDKKKFLSALVTLKVKVDVDTQVPTNQLDGDAKDVDPECTTTNQAQNSQKWKTYIENAIKKYNSDEEVCVSRAQTLKKFRILEKDFSIPGGELTSTMKIKRSVVVKNYQSVIDSMYTPGN